MEKSSSRILLSLSAIWLIEYLFRHNQWKLEKFPLFVIDLVKAFWREKVLSRLGKCIVAHCRERIWKCAVAHAVLHREDNKMVKPILIWTSLMTWQKKNVPAIGKYKRKDAQWISMINYNIFTFLAFVRCS